MRFWISYVAISPVNKKNKTIQKKIYKKGILQYCFILQKSVLDKIKEVKSAIGVSPPSFLTFFSHKLLRILFSFMNWLSPCNWKYYIKRTALFCFLTVYLTSRKAWISIPFLPSLLKKHGRLISQTKYSFIWGLVKSHMINKA